MPIRDAPDLPSALAGLIVLVVVLGIHADLGRRAVADLGREDVEARTWSKQTWFLVIVLAAIVGPLAWFAFGRNERR